MIKTTRKIAKKKGNILENGIEQVPEIKRDARRIETEKVRAREPSRREKTPPTIAIRTKFTLQEAIYYLVHTKITKNRYISNGLNASLETLAGGLLRVNCISNF